MTFKKKGVFGNLLFQKGQEDKRSKYHQENSVFVLDTPGHINRETQQFWQHVQEQWKFNTENSNMETGRVTQNFTINPGWLQTHDLTDIAFSKSFMQESPLPTGQTWYQSGLLVSGLSYS